MEKGEHQIGPDLFVRREHIHTVGLTLIDSAPKSRQTLSTVRVLSSDQAWDRSVMTRNT